MEQLNRIEIRGNVGNVNILKVGESRVAHFSVATNYAYKDRNGEAVIETTWHNVTAWEGKGIGNLDFLAQGACVYVTGRMRSQKYTANDGAEKYYMEIIAAAVTPVEEAQAAQYGM